MLVASLLLSLVGIAVAGYLTIIHYQDDLLVCGIGGGCHTVQNSEYSEVGGIPVALFGLGMYVTILGLTAWRWFRPEQAFVAGAAAFAILLAGTMYAAYLTYVELWVIDAICQWCVTSAIVTLLLLFIEGSSVWRLIDEPAV